MGFDLCNRALKIQESFWDSNSQHGSSLGNVRVHALTLFALSRACEVTTRSPSWPTTLQPPCFGHEPKARIATFRNPYDVFTFKPKCYLYSFRFVLTFI
jgi:hypothetical protein